MGYKSTKFIKFSIKFYFSFACLKFDFGENSGAGEKFLVLGMWFQSGGLKLWENRPKTPPISFRFPYFKFDFVENSRF